jgi:hypothetical protein
MKKPALLALVFPVVALSPLQAVTLVSETFADGDRTGNNPPGSLNWLYGAHHATAASAYTNLTVGSNQMVWDHTLSAGVNSFSGVWGHFAPSGSPVNVGVGEVLRLSFDVSFSGGGLSGSTGAFRWALFNSNGARVSSDFAGTSEPGLASGTTFSGWRGYEGQTVVNSSTASNGLLTRERAGTGNGLFTSSNWSTLTGSAVNSPVTSAATTFPVMLELSRTSVGEMAIVASFGTAQTQQVVDSINPFTAFDTIAFFTLDGLTHDITLSNINLTLVPEPSASLLCMLGLIGLAARRRR